MKKSQEDQIITEFLVSIGPWSEFIVIGGGFALFIYKLYLADPSLTNFPIGTRDIDSLIPRRVPEASKKNIAKHLHESGFKPIFKDLNFPATESYVKNINGMDVEIEFLTDDSARYDKNKNVTIAGIVAQPLSYLSLSIQMNMQFKTFSQKIGRVVAPGAWIFHKALTFTRRKNSLKSLKDLYGLWYVGSQLGNFSDMALLDFEQLKIEQAKWFMTIQKNLQNWLDAATPNTWMQLESQDPSGKLKKFHFEKVLTKLLTK